MSLSHVFSDDSMTLETAFPPTAFSICYVIVAILLRGCVSSLLTPLAFTRLPIADSKYSLPRNTDMERAELTIAARPGLRCLLSVGKSRVHA